MVKDNHPLQRAFSTLTQGLLDEIIKSIHIDPQFKPILPMVRSDWVYFSLRYGAIEISDKLPTSIKKWKTEFFFVDASPFGVPTHFENLLNRDHDSNLELTIDDQSTIDSLVANYVKWSDPNDSILELVGLEGVLYIVGRPLAPALRGYPTCFSSEGVLDSESSIDFHVQPDSGDPVVISSSPSNKRKKKDDRSKGKLLIFSLSKPAGKIRTSSKRKRDLSSSEGVIVSEVEHVDPQVVSMNKTMNPKDLVLPKRLRSTRHTKPTSLLDANKVAEDPSLNNPTIAKPPPLPNTDPSLLHDCPIKNDPDLVTAVRLYQILR
ncbi:unnamed protein product [Lactuca virosa]|uniref:Uncharacterized protein n=1 Tax=Lactuca virosa TaxID=75947 RepID=A0AAU9MK53_9ASTR|nr:unnamed protein product [Lactuca virosa]